MPHKNPEEAKKYHRLYREKHKEKQKEYQKAYRLVNDFSEYKKEWYRSKRFDKYGITKEYFESLLEKQEHRCFICRVPFSVEQRPNIDHCHTTNKVRGLLCLNCNTGIGQLRDDPKLVYKALCYLEGVEE